MLPGGALIAHEENPGFTGGMNGSVAASRGEYAYLIDDDVEVEPACTRKLVDYLALCRRPLPLSGHLPHDDRWRRQGAGAPAWRDTYPVMCRSGAVIMARRSLLRDLRGFRDDFFMFVEDVRLWTRVLKRGLAIAMVPTASLVHADPEPGVPSSIEFQNIKELATCTRRMPRFVCCRCSSHGTALLDFFRAEWWTSCWPIASCSDSPTDGRTHEYERAERGVFPPGSSTFSTRR